MHRVPRNAICSPSTLAPGKSLVRWRLVPPNPQPTSSTFNRLPCPEKRIKEERLRP